MQSKEIGGCTFQVLLKKISVCVSHLHQFGTHILETGDCQSLSLVHLLYGIAGSLLIARIIIALRVTSFERSRCQQQTQVCSHKVCNHKNQGEILSRCSDHRPKVTQDWECAEVIAGWQATDKIS